MRKGRRKKRTSLPASESTNDTGPAGAGLLFISLALSLCRLQLNSHFRERVGTGGKENKVERHFGIGDIGHDDLGLGGGVQPRSEPDELVLHWPG
jgi:hypothetical protein